MKKLALILAVALSFSTTAMAVDIAMSTQTSWWPEATATTEMQEIADNVTDPEVDVQIFAAADEAALADWVAAHTGNGQQDLLILCGSFPDSIYPGGNAQPDGSLAELFLDDGNTIINTGDWMFYVNTAGNNNGAGGLQNMMDIDGISMDQPAADVVPTAEAAEYTPSSEGFAPSRPWRLDELANDWEPELILGVNDDGTRADPAIIVNTVTGGRLGSFFQIADALTDIRGEVISEWINNWYLLNVSDPNLARGPIPTGGETDVYRYTDLSWTAGSSAVAHDVYFGTVQADVESATRDNPMGLLLSQGQAGTTYDLPEALEFGVTYYWRIDEINADSTVVKGNVWSFTAEQLAYPIENITATSNTTSEADKGPERLVDGSGLNDDDQHSVLTADMWGGTPNPDEPSYVLFEFDGIYKLYELLVWNYNMEFEAFLGIGAKDITLEYTENGTDWTVLGDYELAQGPGTATYAANSTIALEGVAAQAVRMTVNSTFNASSSLIGLSEVRFMCIPVQPSRPQPADGDTDVAIDTSLNWRPGREAVSHDVYLGADPNVLDVVGTTTQDTYTPDALNLNTTHYWQIVEVNTAATPSAWAGAVWSFTTQEYLVVDDFESYIDDETAGDVIWEIWIDGLVEFGGDAANGGSQVGHNTSPFAEQTIVNNGSQSMPLYFNNASASAVSEVDLALSPAQDWSANGIESLTLWFYGAEGNGGQLYVKINDTKVVYGGPAVNLLRPAWQMWSIDLSTVGNVSNITNLSIGVEGTGSGVVYIDDIRLYPEVFEYLTLDITGAGDTVVGVPNDGPNTANTEEGWPTGETPELAIDDDANTKFLHFKGEVEPTGIQITPLLGSTTVTELTFTTANDAAERDPVTFELYGSNTSIDGPYTLIASGDIVDFAGTDEWPRFTKTETPITFANTVAYTHYQILFPTLRDADSANSMQIGEIELIGTVQ